MEKPERNTSRKNIKERFLSILDLENRFVVNQLLDASNPADPNLKRNLTITPENTGERLNEEYFSGFEMKLIV